MRNCGDAISSYILKQCLDVEPEFASADESHLSAVGSIISMSNSNSHIWGSGMLGPKWTVPALDAANIHAVRGKKTLALLRERGIALGDIPLGDPGILVDDVMKPFRNEPALAGVKYRAAIVPHHSALTQAEYKAYYGMDDLCVISMIDDTLLPLKQIMQSEVVISHSLHGLIFAEALGKPSVWISHTPDDEWCFKFHDWYSTTRAPQAKPLPLNTKIDDLIHWARRSDHAIDKAALLGSFPAKLIEQKPVDFIGFEECRARKFAVADIANEAFIDAASATQLEDKARAEFQWRVSKQFKDRFADWGEPAYACLRPHKARFRPSDIDAATDFLDQNLKFEFALLADPDEASSAGYDRIFHKGDAAYGVVESGVRKGAIVMRPHGWFSPSSPHVSLVPLHAGGPA